jgi:hypothetical protein
MASWRTDRRQRTYWSMHLSCWIQLRTAIRLIQSTWIFQRLRVRHQLLLNEMSVSIVPARCMWLGSYLLGKIQKIRIGDAVSIRDIKVTSGVPQWSHLGPLCFIWFVNRISEIFDHIRVTLLRRWHEARSSCQWILGLFENSVGSEQNCQKLNASQRW